MAITAKGLIARILSYLQRLTRLETIGLIVAISGLIVAVFALPQIQELFANPRDKVRQLGYEWSSDGLNKAVDAEDAAAVDQYVNGNMFIASTLIQSALNGRAKIVYSGVSFTSHGDEVLLALAKSKNIDPNTCDDLLESGGGDWARNVISKEGAKRLFVTSCGGNAHKAAFAKAAGEMHYNYEMGPMEPLWDQTQLAQLARLVD